MECTLREKSLSHWTNINELRTAVLQNMKRGPQRKPAKKASKKSRKTHCVKLGCAKTEAVKQVEQLHNPLRNARLHNPRLYNQTSEKVRVPGISENSVCENRRQLRFPTLPLAKWSSDRKPVEPPGRRKKNHTHTKRTQRGKGDIFFTIRARDAWELSNQQTMGIFSPHF